MLVTDTAIGLLAVRGMRGLTHRATDELAQLPTGSTSNVYRTRTSILDGVAERVEELLSEHAALATRNQMPVVDYAFDLATAHRDTFRAMLLLAADPALPIESRAKTDGALAAVIGTFSERGGIDVSTAKALLGLLFVQAMHGGPRREEIEVFLSGHSG